MSDYNSTDDKCSGESYRDKQVLRRLYHDEGMSQSKIADRFDVSQSVIHKWMKKFGIESRSQTEAQQLNDIDEPYCDETVLRELYHGEGMTQTEMAESLGCEQTTVSKWMARHDIEQRGASTYKDKSTLRQLYNNEKMSQPEIAEYFGVDASVVKYWVEKHGIETRSNSEAGSLHHSRQPISFDVDVNGYERSRDGSNGEHEQVFVHRLAAVAWFGWDAVTDNVVHHKNGHKRDNREENLEVMTKEDHTRLHTLGKSWTCS